MKLNRWLLLVVMLGLTGVVGATDVVRTFVCIPCTPYCKTHPTSPRCN